MHPALLVALAASGTLVALPLAAETRQHGNVIYDQPTGWTTGATLPNGTLVLLADLPDGDCDYCRIYITTGDTGQPPLAAYLTAQSRRLIDPDDIDPPQIETLSAPELAGLSGRPGALAGQKSDDDLQLFIAVQLFGRVELMVFEGPAYDQDDLDRTMRVFQRDMLPLVEGARFVSEGAKPLMPAAEPGDLSGIWWGTSTWWAPGLDGMLQMQIDHRWLAFWPDGHFYDGTPPGGTAGFEPAARQALGDMSWGAYAESAGTVTLSYASGRVETIEVAGDGFTADDTALARIETLADGTRLTGTVSTMFYSGFTPGSGLQGGVSASSLTLFQPDGTWLSRSGGGAFASFETGGGFASSSDHEEGGTYEVANGLLVRRGRDGTVKDLDLIFKAGADIWIGTEVLDPSGG